MRVLFSAAAAVAFAFVTLAPLSASATGTYLRKGSQKVKVYVSGGKLYCKRTSDGFEMCNGMRKSGGKWKGNKMHHPDYNFMNWTGTVKITGSTLWIQGCVGSTFLCASETWKKK